jgi:membrane-bound serine protease (ClpP class)
MIAYLSDPNFVYVVLLAGLVGLLFEIKNPGVIIPGALGVICLFFVFSVQELNLNGTGIFAILAGFLALVLEIYVTSLGILSIIGISSLLYGSHVLFDTPENNGAFVSRGLIYTVGLSISAGVLLIGGLLAKSQRDALLKYGGKGKASKRSGPDSGDAPGTLHVATVLEEIGPAEKMGKIFYKGTYWNAQLSVNSSQQKNQNFEVQNFRSETSLQKGTSVQITGWNGLTARVVPFHSAVSSSQ